MALFSIAAQTFAVNETVTTTPVTIPPDLAFAKVTLNLTDAQKQDPDTNVTGTVEWASVDTPNDWSLIGQTRLEGRPENDPTRPVFIAISGRTLNQIVGQWVRGRLTNDGATPITFGGTVEIV